jgi:hypothetical protein
MTFPFLSEAPGPTAITVASGRGLLVAEAGRKIPVAVFYQEKCFRLDTTQRISGAPYLA